MLLRMGLCWVPPVLGLHFPALWNLQAVSSDFLGAHGVRKFKKIKYWDSDGQTLSHAHYEAPENTQAKILCAPKAVPEARARR